MMTPLPPAFAIVKVDFGTEDYKRCMQVRNKVFVEEQGYDAAVEEDDDDQHCIHFLILADGMTPVGNVRFLEKKSKLGRLAVLPAYRSHKLGAKLVARVQEYAVEQAKAKGASEAIVMCHSQHQVVKFYEKLGYLPEGPRFDEEGTEHQKMVQTTKIN